MTALYLTEPGTQVRYTNETLTVQRRDQRQTLRLGELDLVVILPGVQLTSVVIAMLLDRGIETLFLTQTGQFRGRLQGQFPTNVPIRLAQYRTVETSFGLALAQRWVLGKVRNQRVLLQRRNRATQGRIPALAEVIEGMGTYQRQLQQLVDSGGEVWERDRLMGLEGICARLYYQALRYYFPESWGFSGRNRRPPLDPINALLSWGYGVLLSRVFAAAVQAGLDPYLGFFHAVEPYRPNLVLDLMEEFRPVVVDQAVIKLLQQEVLGPEDFEPSPEGAGIWLGPVAKRLLLAELERQLGAAVTYVPQGRKLRLRQILVEQGRSVARCLVERRLDYEAFGLK